MGEWVWSSEPREVMAGIQVAVGWTMWMKRTAGVRGTREAEFFYCVIEYET